MSDRCLICRSDGGNDLDFDSSETENQWYCDHCNRYFSADLAVCPCGARVDPELGLAKMDDGHTWMSLPEPQSKAPDFASDPIIMFDPIYMGPDIDELLMVISRLEHEISLAPVESIPNHVRVAIQDLFDAAEEFNHDET